MSRGGREDTWLSREVSIEKSEDVGAAMDENYTMLCHIAMPLTLLPYEHKEGSRVMDRETLFYLSLERSEACWKHICGYIQIDSCWCCQSVVGTGEGGGTWLQSKMENEKMNQASVSQRGPVWEDQLCQGMSWFSPVWNQEVANPGVSIQGQGSEQTGYDTICQTR